MGVNCRRLADLLMEQYRAAPAALPAGNPLRPAVLAPLSVALRLRFDRYGDVADLEEAVGRRP